MDELQTNNENFTVQKYCDYLYQVKKVDGGYGWFIYDKFSKGREIIQKYEEVCDNHQGAWQDARDAITYYYQ